MDLLKTGMNNKSRIHNYGSNSKMVNLKGSNLNLDFKNYNHHPSTIIINNSVLMRMIHAHYNGLLKDQ